MHHRALCVVAVYGAFALGIGAHRCLAQVDCGSWLRRVATGTPPAARAMHGMVYDSARQRLVLFGGRSNSVVYNETWEFDGLAWSLRNTAPAGQPQPLAPPARVQFGMAFDSVRGRTVVFGGTVGVGYLGDTWEWDGAAWIARATTGAAPSARVAPCMAFDAARGRTVLFGGLGQTGGVRDDTWEWDGATWMQVTPTGERPPARVWSAMTWDPSRAACVVFGGYTFNAPAPNDLLGDTWAWNGTAWSQVSTSPADGRSNHCLAYDATCGALVAFGGYQPGAVPSRDDTVQLIGGTWMNVAAGSPSRRSNSALSWDAGRGRLVLFGGADDTAPATYWNDTWERTRPLRVPPSGFPVITSIGGAVAALDGTSIVLSRIGGSGEDGAVIDLVSPPAPPPSPPGSSAGVMVLGWSPIDTPAAPGAGTTISILSRGMLGGNAAASIGTLSAVLSSVTPLPASPVLVRADWSAIGATTSRVQVLSQNTLVRSATAQPASPAAVASASRWPIGARAMRFPTTCGFALSFPAATSFVVSGQTVSGDELRVYAERPGQRPEWVSGVVLKAAGVGTLTLQQIGWTQPAVCLADVVGVGSQPPGDGLLTGDDFVAFVNAFGQGDLIADVTGIGGPPAVPDSLVTGDDFVAFVNAFANGCP